MDKVLESILKISNGKSGIFNTTIEGVRVFYFEESMPRQPRMYDGGIVIIWKGSKVGYIEEDTIYYNSDNYLVVGAPTPLECEAFASEQEPLAGLIIDINMQTLQNIWLQMDQGSLSQGIKISSKTKLAHATEMTQPMKDLCGRLAFCLCNSESARILGQDIVKEMYYHTLKDRQASVLYALADRYSHFAKISEVLNFIKLNLRDTITVETLADISGMSVPTFHRVFKQVAGDSPIKFIQKSRLTLARDLIELHGQRVNIAAQNVGYDNVSQFSREFKRLYGVSPKYLRSI